MARKEHVDNRQQRNPRQIPEIKQGLVGERWVRTTSARPPTTPVTPWTITAAGIFNTFLGTATNSGSYIILKKLRIWVPDTTDVVNLTVDIFAGPVVISTVTSNAFTRHRATNVEGAQAAIIQVELGEYWRIYPINSSTTLLVAQIQLLTPATLTSVYVDVLAHVQHRPIITTTLSSQPENESDKEHKPDESHKDFELVESVSKLTV